jgi:hypothetical protein
LSKEAKIKKKLMKKSLRNWLYCTSIRKTVKKGTYKMRLYGNETKGMRRPERN